MPIARLFTWFTFFCFFYIILSLPTAAQSGSWQPTGADLSFPRTLLKKAELPAVRQSLQEPARKTLYQSVYAWAQTMPTANYYNDERRLRARAAKNKAFVRLINLSSNTTDSLTATEKTQFEDEAIYLLNNLNSAVDPFWSYENWQWRSKELIDYLVAYDLLRGAGVAENRLTTAKTNLQNFAGGLYSNGSGLVGSINNNHLFMTAAALGMAGIVLNDMTSSSTAKQPQSWINIGIFNIDNAMWRNAGRQSEPGVMAGYAEGPYYFKYAMENCLPFFRAFGNFLPDGTYSFTWNNVTHQIRNPFHDPNYDSLYQWIKDITLPDGRLPALEDSYMDMAMPELALTGKAQYVKNFYPQNLEPAQLNTLNAQLDGTVDLRANYLAANLNPAPATEKTLTVSSTSGNLIFRSGNGFGSNYLHVYGKNGNALNNSGGHNHGDAGSFILYAKGQLLALDAGYLNYSRRGEVGNANNHNLVLVDGAGPLIGTTTATNDAAAYIKNAFELSSLQYGEVHTAYNSANIIRKTLSVRGEYYLMADFISAAAAHNFTWQLHGFGLENGMAADGVFTDNSLNHEGTWLKNGVTLKAHVTANGGASSYSKTTSKHETTYDRAANHTTFLVNKDNVSQTQFLAALHADSLQTATTSTLSVPGLAALVTVSPTFTDLAFSQTDTLLQTVSTPILPATVKSDANLTFFSVDNSGDFGQLFLQNGTTLFYRTERIIQANKRADIAWEQLGKGEYQGYVNKSATLLVKTGKRPDKVTGQYLSSWTYDVSSGLLTAVFSQPSEFRLSVATTPLPVTLLKFEAKENHKKVELTWQTASEKDNAWFEVQRTTDGKTWETITKIAGRGTTSELSNYSYTDKPDFSGRIYYRLKQTDLNGAFSYSAVRSISISEQPQSTITYFPNPATNYLEITLENAEAGTAAITFYNALGIKSHSIKRMIATGANKLQVELPADMKAGLYLVQLRVGSELHTFRVLKQ